MIKEKIPELQKLSTADKFALAVELWDELSSNPDEIPVTEDQLNELDRRFEEYRQDPDKVVTWEGARQGSFPVGVNGGCLSSLCRTGPSRGVSNRIVVHAILDLRQDPEKIRERFSE